MLVAIRGLALRRVRRSEVQKSPTLAGPAFPSSRFHTSVTSRSLLLRNFRDSNSRTRTSHLQDSVQAARQPRCRYISNSPSSEPSSFSDPSRPDLFYHLAGPPNPLSSNLPAFAVSFLDEPPPIPSSSTIIGWLPAASEASGKQASLSDFKENPKFRELLHEAIWTALHERLDDVQTNGALQLQQGWMHIHDDRNIPALGRIGDPDDIIASVLVQDGQILPETYQPMPSYRFCTHDGMIQLTEGLAKKLKSVLKEQLQVERFRGH